MSASSDETIEAGGAITDVLDRAEAAIASVVGVTSEGRTATSEERVPPEKLLRPPWLSPIWGNDTIGSQAYEPLLGIGAITDALDVQISHAKALSEAATLQEVGRLLAEDAAQPDQKDAVSIEEAVAHLVRTYAYTKLEHGSSAIDFVRRYCQRPIATLLDLLADPDSFQNANGGFHRNAYGDVEPMEGLPDGALPPSGKSGPKSKVAGNMDPRRGRWLAVQEYVAELRDGTVLRG